MRAADRVLGLVLLVGLTLTSARAGADAGAGVQSVFSAGSGNRALAMGSAFVATADDATALIWNPAGLAEMQRGEAQFSQSNGLGLGFREAMLAMGVPDWRWGAGALSIRSFGIDGLEQRDDRNDLISSDLADHELEVLLGYANKLGSGLSVGGALKAQRQSILGFSAMGLGADVGMRLVPGRWLWRESERADQVVWGVSVRNLLRPSLRLDQEPVDDPTSVRTGLEWRGPVGMLGNLIAELDLEHVVGAGSAVRSGVELRPTPVLAIRSGLDNGRLTAGVGFSWRRFSFDYAYQDNPLAADHRMGVSYGFGRDIEESRALALQKEDERLQARLEQSFSQRRNDQVLELLARAESSRAAGRYDEALEVLGSAATLAPEEPRVHALERACLAQKASALQASGDFTGAALTYDLILAKAPADSEAAAGARQARAASDARTARSTELRARFAAALDHFSVGRLAEARQELVALLAVAPADSDAANMLRRTEQSIARGVAEALDRADDAMRAGRVPDALAALKTAEALEPATPGLASRRAECARALKDQASVHETPKPPASHTHAPAKPTGPTLDPGELARLYRRGVEAQGEGHQDEAIHCWELVQAASPGYRGVDRSLTREYLTRGMDAFAAGRLDEAIRDWEQVLRIDPNDARAQGYLERAKEQSSRLHQILGVNR